MPRRLDVQIPVGDLTLHDAEGRRVPLGEVRGRCIVVLMRHRH